MNKLKMMNNAPLYSNSNTWVHVLLIFMPILNQNKGYANFI